MTRKDYCHLIIHLLTEIKYNAYIAGNCRQAIRYYFVRKQPYLPGQKHAKIDRFRGNPKLNAVLLDVYGLEKYFHTNIILYSRHNNNVLRFYVRVELGAEAPGRIDMSFINVCMYGLCCIMVYVVSLYRF